MNSKRKADLQRKLAMTSVPKPPAGLAEQIKKQIPESLGEVQPFEASRRRATWSLGIAASLVVLISSAYIALRVAPHGAAPLAPAPARVEKQSVPLTTPAAQPAVAVSSAAPLPAAPAEEIGRAADQPPAHAAEAKREEIAIVARAEPASDREKKAQSNALTAEAAPAPAPAPAEPPVYSRVPPAAPPVAVAEARPEVQRSAITKDEAAATAKSAAAERRAAVDAVVGGVLGGTGGVRESIGVAQAAPSGKLVRSTPAAFTTPPLAAPWTKFGISVDPAAVAHVREALDRDERPEKVDVAALVNYFAGSPEEIPTEISLRLEGSHPPVSLKEETRLVRLSVDAPGAAGTSPLVAATDLHLSVVFDSRTVASHRLIGGREVASSSEPLLYENTSVTALYEIELKPGARDRQQVAAAVLHYRDRSGHTRTLAPRPLRVRDVDGRWADSSRRNRIASLVAIWGETLKNETSGADVAQRAEELANQEPRDSKARELARLTTASSRLRSSSPTGSGR